MKIKDRVFRFLPYLIILTLLFIFIMIDNKVIIIILLLCLILIFFTRFIDKRSYQKELLTLSEMLETQEQTVLLGDTSIYEDYLSSKIAHQLLRMQHIFTEREKSIQDDRDEIRVLINEIAHQLRTPTTNLRLYTDLMGTTKLTKEQKNHLSNINQAIESISFLNESFIKMSRMEGKVIQLKKHEQSLSDVIQKAIMTNDRNAQEKNISVLFEPTPIVASIDINWMIEAVSNLIDNAIKYSEENSEIIIETIQNEMFKKIIISDNGIGFNEEEDSKVFKRFYRGENTANELGYGLGLYISDLIVKAHEGYIRVDHKEKGTIFTIVLL